MVDFKELCPKSNILERFLGFFSLVFEPVVFVSFHFKDSKQHDVARKTGSENMLVDWQMG
jgi:hypothetical protein